MTLSVEEIVTEIVELSLDRCTGDSVRDIYTVLMDITLEISKLFKLIREQENG
jgi:hypothetical protein